MALFLPPIRYYGGKGAMYNKIISEFPPISSFDTYIEVFGGSYSVGLAKPQVSVEIYNDIEQNVYSLFHVISNKEMFSIFKDMCDLSYYSEDLRRESKTKLKDKGLSEIERAFHFFYLNRTSHNSVGGFSVHTGVRRKVSKSISDFLSAIDRLPELHQRLSNVIIRNVDGVSLINQYSDRENVFFYCDPPYEQGTRTGARYDEDMDSEKQEEFINSVIGKKAKFLISGYDCALYEKLVQNGYKKKHFEIKTRDNHNIPKMKIETLWKNY